MLNAVHKPASPDKLSGEQAETKQNHNPSGTGGDQHHDSGQQQSEPGHNAEDTPDLFHRSKHHLVRQSRGSFEDGRQPGGKQVNREEDCFQGEAEL